MKPALYLPNSFAMAPSAWLGSRGLSPAAVEGMAADQIQAAIADCEERRNQLLILLQPGLSVEHQPPMPLPPRVFLPGGVAANTCSFVVDTSGSMYELFPSVQAGLCRAVNSLSAAVAFNVIAYATEVTAWRPHLHAATDHNKESACAWVMQLAVGGSTNTLGALRKALADPRAEALLLLSDGMPDDKPRDILAVGWVLVRIPRRV